MKRKQMLLLLCSAMGVVIISFAEGTPGEKPSANKEMLQMRNELNQLRAKVEMLEYRTKSLESTVQALKQTHSPTPLSQQGASPLWLNPPAAGSVTPKIWGQKEVNGWTYYIVPCEQPGR